MPATTKGHLYENKARKFLQRQGLRDFQTNYRTRQGEIDIIARQVEVLVFIEVRYREHQNHGTAAKTVTFRKQQKNGLTNKIPCRFDVISISGSEGKLKYQLIKNAF